MYGTLVSWNPVTKVEAAVVPILPLITVLIPELVNPALPPVAPANVEAVPRLGPVGPTEAPVVNVQGFAIVPAASALPARSFAAFVIVAVYCVVAARFAVGVNVAVLLTGL